MSTVASGLIFLAARKAIQIFPENVKKLWSKWELRVMITASLVLQIVLVMFGSRRKSTKASWIAFVVWLSYLLADSVATLSLGLISSSSGEDPNGGLLVFWSPFLLLHLGGPDTITAYSTEDNELWLRHLLGLVTQVVAAFYAFLTSWSTSVLTFITIPVFISGVVKYGERTWALRSASSDHFQAPELSPPTQLLAMNLRPDEKYLHEAFYLFSMFKHLFTGVILNTDEAEYSYSIICKKSAEEAFKLVEIELSLMYDLLYTKAKIVYSMPGVLLRFLTFTSAVSVLIIFCIAIDKRVYSHLDVAITMLLLVGAIALEVYAGFTAALSDWTMMLLIKLRNPFADFLYRTTWSSRLYSFYNKRWSGSMGQLNLISYCSTDRFMKFIEDEPFGFCFMLETSLRVMQAEASVVLKEQIFKRLMENHSRCQDSGFDPRTIKELLGERGDFALRKRNCLTELQWSTISIDFDQSLLLWHIATDLCYYSELNDVSLAACVMSQLLSDYMLHIQVVRPFLLPKSIGRAKYLEETYKQATAFFRQKGLKTKSGRDARDLLFKEYKQTLHSLQISTSSLVLLNGRRLAEGLQSLVMELGWTKEQLWEMVCEFWVEMLIYAAGKCEWNNHAQQLRRGGELLTHVCLLMAHLGLAEQFQGKLVNIKIPERMDVPNLAGRSIDDPAFDVFPA
ncbi:uncharacterized protein LOC115738088 [Rhodamnia argentea]|uniref:Uncharacterized protein LOC115738088 n=1 Tax=Rhodamnia argentea TaxID=178133 RepID=A0A8B8NXH8_9MYRT|nr:uncharacterized protein LOC115738088 [Rhodamnia argentea]XP_030526453.1 uncharacterized protein LOC115738088 [Rhodamnia argentea]